MYCTFMHSATIGLGHFESDLILFGNFDYNLVMAFRYGCGCWKDDGAITAVVGATMEPSRLLHMQLLVM